MEPSGAARVIMVRIMGLGGELVAGDWILDTSNWKKPRIARIYTDEVIRHSHINCDLCVFASLR